MAAGPASLDENSIVVFFHFRFDLIVLETNGADPFRTNSTARLPWPSGPQLQNDKRHLPDTGNSFPARSGIASRYEINSALRPLVGLSETDLTPGLSGLDCIATVINPFDSSGFHH